jgi:hypothetical protein
VPGVARCGVDSDFLRSRRPLGRGHAGRAQQRRPRGADNDGRHTKVTQAEARELRR